MNKKRLWTRAAAWLLTLCLLAGLCVPTVRAEGEIEATENTAEVSVPDSGGHWDGASSPLAARNSNGTVDVGVDGLDVKYVFNNDGPLLDKNKATLVGPTRSEAGITIGVKSHQYNRKTWNTGWVELTLTNTLTSRAKISFKASLSPNYGTMEFSEGEFVETYEGELEPGGSIKFKMTSSDDSNGPQGIILNLTEIKLEAIVLKTTTTFLTADHGKYTVNDETVTADTAPKEGESTEPFQLSAEADTGYRFAGWQSIKDGVANFITDENPYVYYPLEDATIQPMFVSKNSATYMVGSRQFFDLNYANAYAVSSGINKIVLTGSGALPKGEYEISKDVTLLIPYSGDTTIHTTEPSTTKNQDAASGWTPYKTLTMQAGAHITVYGAINVDSLVTGNKSEPTGPYGLIQTGEDTSILLKDGANLYCWGFITGDGEVRAQSGASVYECFQLLGWRGGDTSSKMVGNTSKVFPVNKYAVQNVEATLVLEAGAMEKVYASVYLKKTIIITLQDQGAATTDFIGKENGMFRLTAGEISRKYLPAQDRVYYTVNGTLTISKLVLDLSLKTFSMNISLDTQAYVMPLMGNFTIDIKSGTTSIAGVQDLSLMPGAKFIVSEGATFQCSSALFAYDYETYVGKSYAYPNDTVAIPYSPTKGYIRQANINDMPDAEIDVNGTLQVTGTLFTTVELLNNEADPDQKYGANIHSSLGTGKIVFESSANLKRTAVYESKSNATDSYDGIPITPARLRNGDGSYVETSSVKIQDGVAWTYFYDRGATEQWYRFKIQFVMKDNPDVIVYQELVASDTASVKLPGLSGTVTTEISGGKVTKNSWDSEAQTLTLTGITPDIPEDGSAPVLKVKVTAAVNSYKPYFVLNEKQYGNYRSYTGKTITDTVDIGGKTYYVVQSSDTLLKFGEKLTGPTDESMGVSAGNHNGITWFLEDITTGAQVFGGTVPSGETEGGPVYIYGIYSGYEVKVTRNGADEYYTTLKEAVTALPQTGSATVQMLANCGTFEDESKTASYSFIANITFDLNGKEVWGSLVNNGTLTLMDSAGGGKIISATTSTTNNPASFAYAIRNNGTLSMENITVVGGSQTNNDYFVGVLNVTTASQQDVSTIDSIKNCTINVTNGYGIYNFSGTINTIAGGSITAKYGIYNRNLRTQNLSSGVSPAIKAAATIGTIQDTIVTVTQQYALWNGGKINTICGNSKFLNTGTSNYIVYNSNQWFYDYYITSRKDDTSTGYVRTDERKEDDTIIPTIGTITDNVEISSSTCSYGLANYGKIGSIEGNVKIFANSNALAVLDGGKIDSINGNGETGITIEATATERGISISGQKTMQQKTTYSDKIGGTVTSIETTYYEDRPSSIGTITGKVTISAKSNYGIINYGVIDSITGADVTIQANRYALYNTEGGRVLTEKQTRRNLGQVDEASAGYLTLYEYERTYHEQGPYIGTIDGITVKCTEYTGLTNHGTIDTIKDVNATATYNAICNVNGHFTERKSFSLWHGASAWATSPNYAWDVAISYTRLQPTIGSITGTTATTTSAYGALVNTGVIKTIDGCTLTANTYNALSNSLCGTGYYLGNKASTYVEYKQFILLEGSKYVFRPLDSTTSYTRGEIGTITNTKITAKKVSDWCAALDNNGKIGTIGAGTVVNVKSAATTNNKDRTYGIRVSGDCYVTRRDVYKNVTETIKALGTPTSGQYYRQDEFYNTYDDNIYAEIGSISGVTVTNPYGYGILNSGIIENINSGTSVSSYQGAIFNSDGRYVGTKNSVQLRSGTTAYATTTSVVSESNYLYSRLPAEITLIDGVKLEATGTYYGVYNRGHIGTIKKSTIAAAESYAIRNENKTYLTYEVKATGNSVEGLNAYLAWDGTKYVFVTAVASTKTYDATCQPAVIDLIGEGNTLTAKANTIYNAGTITKIDGGTAKTSVTATGGVGIYNYQGANLSENFVAGKATYTYQSASIGTITNTVVAAATQALVNGDGTSAYRAVKIDGLGEGNVFTSQNSHGVTNNIYASIGTISGGIYTAGGSGYGLQNNNDSAAIDISATTESGPYFKGGTPGRTNAIYEPDNIHRQTYPTGYTLSGVTRSATVNGTAADGYYFVTKNEFTIVFDGNPASKVSGSVASMTVSRTATSVTLPGSGFTRDGFEQVGWALDALTGADSIDLLSLGATVTMARLGNPTAGAEVKLYAVWKPTKTYNITVTWNGDLSYTYTPAVYRWNGATMKYQLESAASWSSTLGTGKWPSVTVTNAGTDSTTEGTVAVEIAYTSATNYNALNMEFTVGDATTTDSAMLSSQLSLRQSASATMKLTGTPPNETANSKVVGSVKLTLTPTDG